MTTIIARVDARAGELGLSDAEIYRRAELPVGLLGEKVAAPVDDAGVRRIPLTQISRSLLNPRQTFDAAGIRDLAESIAAQGLLQNIVVRLDEGHSIGEFPTYWIVAGERRWRALSLLANEGRLPEDLIAGIPCKVIAASDAQHLALALLENLQRIDVNAMEEAQGFARLQALDPEKWNTEAIARAIGKIKADDGDDKARRAGMRFVQQRLALAESLCPDGQAALLAGRITFSQARALTMGSADQQRDVLKYIDNYPTERAIRRQITHAMIPLSRAAFARDQWTGPVVEDPDSGEIFITDRKTFMALQEACADKLAVELAGKHSFVDRADWYYAGAYEKTDGDGGAVIVVTNSGELKVHTGLKKRTADRKSAAERERIAADDREREARKQATRRFKDDLAAALTFQDAVTLLLHDALSESYGAEGGPLASIGGLPVDLFRPDAPLAALAKLVGKPAHGAAADLRRYKPKAAVENWYQLTALPNENLAAALTALVGRQLKIYDHSDVPLLLIALGRSRGIAVPAILDPGDPDHQRAKDEARAAPAPAPAPAKDDSIPDAVKTVASRVRDVLRDCLPWLDADAVLHDDDDLSSDLGAGPEQAVEIGLALAKEFGLDKPPFIANPDDDFGFDQMGLDTVWKLIDFLERRLRATAAE